MGRALISRRQELQIHVWARRLPSRGLARRPGSAGASPSHSMFSRWRLPGVCFTISVTGVTGAQGLFRANRCATEPADGY